MTERSAIDEYDRVGLEMDDHLNGAVRKEYNDDPVYLVCGCVVTSYPDVEERCPVFLELARQRHAALQRILESARSD